MQTSSDRAQRRVSPRSRQRGAAGIFLVLSLLLLVPILALALNIGQLYYAQRDLEKQATLAALSATQMASGCANGGVPTSLAQVSAEVARVIDVNAMGSNALPSSAVMTGINGAAAVELGTITTTAGLRVFTPLPEGSAGITAVRVNLSRPQPTPFLLPVGAIFGAGSLFASATAEQPALASFRLGTTTLSLKEGALNNLLTGLLGTSVNLTAVGFQGLAQARVTLGNLVVAAGVSDLSDLLELDLTVPEALRIVAIALGATGDATSGLASGLVSGLAGQSFNAGNDVVQNIFGQVFNSFGTGLNPTVEGVLGSVPFVDGLGLLTALGQAASVGKTIRLPVTVNIPGLVGLGLFVQILEPEQVSTPPGRPGFGPGGVAYTQAQSSQVRVATRLNLSLLGLPLIRLALNIDAGNGLSTLIAVHCPSPGNPQPSADIQTTSSLITATVGTFTGSATANPPAPPSSGNVINVLFLVRIIATAMSSTLPGTAHPVQTATGPLLPQALPVLSSNGNLTTLVTSLLASSLQINILGLGLNAGGLLAAILTPVTLLLDTILDPLLASLGVNLGEAGVTVNSITTARPTLVSTCLPGTVACP